MANVENKLAYVLEFSKNSYPEDVSWLLTKLAEADGLVLASSTPSVSQTLTVFVAITPEKIFSIARKCRIKTLEGYFLEENEPTARDDDDHSADNVDDDTSPVREGNEDNRDPRTLFSPADILWMTRHAIDNVRATSKQCLTVGGNAITLFQGQSIVEKMLHKKIIEKMFPLHEKEDLKRLGRDWLEGSVGLKNPSKLLFDKQPLDKVRNYFGEGVAYYFAFLETLTWALLVSATMGFAQLFFPYSFHSHSTFCVLFVFWAFGFMEVWKRHSNGLAFLWGTRNKYGGAHGEPRANYRGEFVVDPISGQLMPSYPRWKTLLKLYGVSMPIVLFCTVVAFWIMLESIWKETMLMEMTSTWPQDEIIWQLLATCLVSIPTVLYAALVYIANLYYRKLAKKLTEWENHRTESQFERNRVTKLLLFEFVNNFMSLFYIAFYLKDIKLLQWQVALMLLVFQVINQLTESLWPYLSKRYTFKNLNVKDDGAKDEAISKVIEFLNVPMLEPNHFRVVQARTESLLEPYEGTHDDYLELFIQFGYVLLFIVAYPTASLWAFVNNVAELRVDAFKIVRIHRRPAPARMAHIGAWAPAFRMLCSIAVVSNCALLYIMFTVGSEETEDVDAWWTRALVCVSLDHFLLAVQSLLGVLVPETPAWVHIARAELKRANRR